MPKDPPPSPARRSTLAYGFYAAAIWALVAYSLWGPKAAPPAQTLASSRQACLR